MGLKEKFDEKARFSDEMGRDWLVVRVDKDWLNGQQKLVLVFLEADDLSGDTDSPNGNEILDESLYTPENEKAENWLTEIRGYLEKEEEPPGSSEDQFFKKFSERLRDR